MRQKRLFSLLALVLLCWPASARAQQRELTIDDIFDPARRINFSGSPPTNLVWTNDGDFYLQSKSEAGATQLLKVNARTGKTAPLFDAAKMEAALARLPGVSAEEARRLAHRAFYQFNPAQTAVLINFGNDLFYYPLNSTTAVRLTNGPEEEFEEDFSPDGRLVSFVRGNNLYVVDVATGRERALTSTGGEKTLNGRLDWVYEEEVYGRGNKRGYWWSPDSTRVAYLSLDETPVHDFPVVDHIPRLQKVEETPYPLAGDPNPLVRLGVVAAAGGDTKWVDTSAYEPTDFLLVRVAWSPDSRRVVYQAQNREQTFLDLNSADADTGRTSKLFQEQTTARVTNPDPAFRGLNSADADTGRTSKLFQEKTPAWVEPFDDNPLWLKDGSFLWRSERSGWSHLYHYSADGRLIQQLTDGHWEMRGVDGVDEPTGWIYFHSTEHSPIAEQIYRVGLDGTGT